MAGGLVKGPNGGVVASAAGRPWANGGVQAVTPTTISPQTVSLLSDATPGGTITPLSFEGFAFGATAPALNLVADAGGRVALAGDWTGGYSLVVGAGELGPAGNYIVSLQFQGEATIHNITVSVSLASSAATLFTSSVENADTVASWADQELSFGQAFAKGDVPAGTVVRALIAGQSVPCQLSERIHWTDGSLKHALVRMLVPQISPGATATITWQRIGGSWNDAPLHASPAAITGNVTLEYVFASWKGRTATTVTAERGPMRLNSTVMFNAANPFIDRVMSGPLCNEWRVSDMATLGDSLTEKHANQGGYLYARAWGGTATTPKRIQFLFRTIYGWSSDVTADEQGIQVNVDLRVNGATVRGSSVGTAGWTNVASWRGGFLVSADVTGLMDWFDVETNAFVTPPAIVHRPNVTYGMASKFFPPYDFNNTAFNNLTPNTQSYLPGKRGPLRPIQDDVADHEMLCWTLPKPPVRCLAAFSKGTAGQILAHQRYCRSVGFGMGAMTGVGLNRVTRKVISYLPPERQSNLAVMGPSVYGLGKVANAAADLRTEIRNLDTSHMPNMTFWPALTEGDQHWLDLMYHEVTLPGVFETPAYGFYGTSSRAKIKFGGITFSGQIRAVGHTARPMVFAMALGRPHDPHHQMAVDHFAHWTEMTRELPLQEDAWRGGLDRTDGRRFQDLKLLWPNNEPTYKLWMHTFGLHSLSFGYGITEDAMVKERADWWAHAPTVLAGGYHNDEGPEYYLMKPDATEAGNYHSLCMNGLTDSGENRRYWHFGQWRGFISPVTYRADGVTCTWTDTVTMTNGQIVTVSGVRSNAEPLWVADNTKVPAGLTRGIPYYTIEAAGQNTKLSLSPGGPPVTFNPGGADMVGQAMRSPVFGVHPQRLGSSVSVDANSYHVQVMAALDMYQHYVAPDDARVLLARRNLFNLKNTSTAPNAYDERGKTIVAR